MLELHHGMVTLADYISPPSPSRCPGADHASFKHCFEHLLRTLDDSL